VKHTSSGDAWVLMMYSGLRESGEPWYTWYRNSWFALHKKRTQHGQLRSIAVCCGQWKTPIMLRQFAKVQVEELGAHRWIVYCQGEGRGFESRRPLQKKLQVRSTFQERLAGCSVAVPSIGLDTLDRHAFVQPKSARALSRRMVGFGVSSKSAISCHRLAIEARRLLVSDVVPRTDEPTRSASRCRPCCLSHS